MTAFLDAAHSANSLQMTSSETYSRTPASEADSPVGDQVRNETRALLRGKGSPISVFHLKRCLRRKAATGDPSTPLRYGQDDSVFGRGALCQQASHQKYSAHVPPYLRLIPVSSCPLHSTAARTLTEGDSEDLTRSAISGLFSNGRGNGQPTTLATGTTPDSFSSLLK
jgi:hypothetical protein